MRIVLVTSERLQEFPPMITLLKTLDRLGHETVFLTPYPDSYFNELSLKHSENQYTLPEPSEYLRKYYKNRVKASLAFRTERLMRRVALHRIITRFTHLFKDSDVVWLLSENTALLAGKHFVDRLGSFLYTMYELRIANKKVPAVYDYAARKALLTVVPEYSRAHIVNAFYGLGQMPSIIPNKPDTHPRTKNMAISDPRIAEEIRSIHETGKKIIMYMGILSNERPLEPIIDALKYNDQYIFTVLGGRTPYLDKLEKTRAGQFIYLGEAKPPQHLEIASHADVAYISYVANDHSINAVFCAPNKVYEFAGFGIPMLCNDNPGLKFTVEYNGMGVCVQELTEEHIRIALKRIDSNFEAMSNAALRYYEEESVEQAVAHTLNRYIALKKGKLN